MSTQYSIYAEILLKDRWYNLNPIVKSFGDGRIKIVPIYVSCSSFYDVHLDLSANSHQRGLPDDLSSEVREEFHPDLDEKIDEWGSTKTWREAYDNSVYTVMYRPFVRDNTIRGRPFKYEGYVHKRQIAAFECNEISYIEEWLTEKEFLELEKHEQRQYTYYRWNEYGDKYEIYCELVNRISTMLSALEYNYYSSEHNLKLGEYLDDPRIRLIVCQD